MRYAARKVFQNNSSAESLNKNILGIVIPKGKSNYIVFRFAVYQPEIVDG